MAFPVFTNGYFQIEEMIFDPAVIVPGETTKYSITIKNVSSVNVSSCYITMEMRYPNTSGGTSDLPYIYLHGAADWKMASISWAKNTSKTFTGTIVYGANNIDVSQYVVPNIGARFDIATTSIFPNMGNNDSTAMTNLTADKIFCVLNKRDNPTLNLDAVRYPDNEAESLSVSAKLNVETDLETISEHGYAISLVRRVDADGELPEEITANCTLDELYAGVVDSTSFTTDVYGNGLDWLLTLIVSNGYESASATVSIAKDFANLHLSGASTGGACFGGFSTSTDGDPKLESYYPIHAYEQIHAHGGIEGYGVLAGNVLSSQVSIASGANLYSPTVTIPRDGLYLMIAFGNFQGASNTTGGQRYIAIQRNGSDIASTHYPHTQGGWPTYYLPEVFPFKAGDIVRSYVQQTSGTTRTCVAGLKIVQLSNAITT